MQKIKHLSKATHNEDFFKSFNLDDTRFRDWVVVALFYSLLHYYEAYFAMNNKHSKTHDKNEGATDIDKDVKIPEGFCAF